MQGYINIDKKEAVAKKEVVVIVRQQNKKTKIALTDRDIYSTTNPKKITERFSCDKNKRQ